MAIPVIKASYTLRFSYLTLIKTCPRSPMANDRLGDQEILSSIECSHAKSLNLDEFVNFFARNCRKRRITSNITLYFVLGKWYNCFFAFIMPCHSNLNRIDFVCLIKLVIFLIQRKLLLNAVIISPYVIKSFLNTSYFTQHHHANKITRFTLATLLEKF